MTTRRERTLLAITAALAVGVPAGTLALVRQRTAALADHLGAAGGVPARIGGVDADLTGAIRLTDVAFGDLVSAGAIEASVALESLLAGELRADEIAVESPRVALEIGPDGDSDLARLARRLARRPATPRATSKPRKLRRIVVTEGALTARVAGIGEVRADSVELVPDAGGVRVVTGPLHVTSHGPADVALAFSRSAAEVAMPDMRVGRVLAVGGSGTIAIGGHAVALREVAAGRLARPTMVDDTSTRAIEVRASLDDGGIPREIALDLTPTAAVLRGDHLPLRLLSTLAPSSVVLDNARASGTLRVARDRDGVRVELAGSVENLALDHKTLAAVPIPVTGDVRATAALASESLTVDSLELDTGAIHARASGFLRRQAPLSGQLELAIASAPCADLLASLPAEIRGPLDGMVLEGALGVSSKLTIDLAAPVGDGAALVADFTGRCKALAEPPAADVTTLAQPSTDDGWVPIAQIPARIQGAFVSAEDGRFWSHAGFDLQQIARSLEIDLRERRLARGGSTISQQLIKNAFLTHRRTLDRKIQEAILTWRLEARLTKQDILERYLNIIELGPTNVRGISAAAKFWFDVTPRTLTTKQAAFLAAITSEPASMSRRVRRHGGLDPVSAERVATILRAMRRDGVISPTQHDTARAQAMNFAPAAIREDR